MQGAPINEHAACHILAMSWAGLARNGGGLQDLRAVGLDNPWALSASSLAAGQADATGGRTADVGEAPGCGARRSDGSVVAWGYDGVGQSTVPPLPAGASYVEVAAGSSRTTVRVGPPSSYVPLCAGCAGSLPAARLVPLDTPRIGAVLRVDVTNLPANAAFVLLGFSNTSSRYGPLPFDLAPVGLPGCRLFASDDAFGSVTGTGGIATYSLPIPGAANLIGLRFYQQALVPDPGAGNALRAVMSDAAAAIVGA